MSKIAKTTSKEEWQPDSDTTIVNEQTILSPIGLKLCCIEIADIMNKPQFKQDRGDLICSRLDELLNKSTGAIAPSAQTLLGEDNKAFQNTQNRPKLANIIAGEVRLHLDKKLTGEAKEMAFNIINGWARNVTANHPGTQHRESQEPSTERELPTELDTEQARKYFARAVDAGLMSEQYKWLESKSQLGYFCYKIYERPRPINELERFFDVKKLSSDITNASISAKRADVKKWRARQDKEIFFD